VPAGGVDIAVTEQRDKDQEGVEEGRLGTKKYENS